MAKKHLWGSAVPGFVALMVALLLSAVLVSTLFASPADSATPDATFEAPTITESSLPVLIGGYVPDGAEAGSPSQPRILSTKPADPDAPVTLDTFDGMNFEDNFTETGNLLIPPDPMAAAGPDRVIAVVNAVIEGRSKTGSLLFRDALKDFFSSLSSPEFPFDP